MVTGEWLPVTSLSLKDGGPGIQVLQKIFTEAGMTAAVEFYPWRRCEVMVESGEAFAAFPYALQPERAERFLLSDPVYYSQGGFFSYNEKGESEPLWKDWDEKALRHESVGIVAGSFVKRRLLESGFSRISENETVDRLVMQLKAGHIHFVLSDILALQESVFRLFPQEASRFIPLKKTFSPKAGYGLIVSRDNAVSGSLLTRINQALFRLKSSGELTDLLKSARLWIP